MRETFGRMIYSVNGVFRYSCEYFQFATLSPNGTLCDLLQCTSNKGLTGEEKLIVATPLMNNAIRTTSQSPP